VNRSCIDHGPLLGASYEDIQQGLIVAEKAFGKRILIINCTSGYCAYFLSFIADFVVCVLPEAECFRSSQFFQAPNLQFVDSDNGIHKDSFDIWIGE